MKKIVLPDNNERTLAFYLAMEEYVAGIFADEAFFVWRVAPTVIVGRNQVLGNEVNMEYCAKNGVHIFRRKSGGGCVYSDMGNVMVSYISGRGVVSAVFDRYLSAMTACLRSLGLDAEKSGRNDIMVCGRKVSGNAFHQLPDRSIVHGTLLYDTDFEALEEAIRPPVEKLERHGVASVRQRVGNLKGFICNAKVQRIEDLEAYIVEYFCDGELQLTDDDVNEIEILEKQYIKL